MGLRMDGIILIILGISDLTIANWLGRLAENSEKIFEETGAAGYNPVGEPATLFILGYGLIVAGLLLFGYAYRGD